MQDIESSTRRNIAIILVIIAVGAFAIGVVRIITLLFLAYTLHSYLYYRHIWLIYIYMYA